jgi:DNA-3-methyladenine glycosylase
MPRPLTPAFFSRETLEVARDLIGATVLHDGVGGVLVEVEAYKGDAASHFVTRRHKGSIMGTSFGKLYVYSIYGMHHCVNVTTERHGPGAVLLRAIEPTHGIDAMRRRRGLDDPHLLASGPGRLFVALGLDPSMNGRDALDVLTILPRRATHDVAAGPRIGITKATDLDWRFWLRGNRFVSR